MIATALEAEVADYIERFADERDEDGRRLVVRNGRARERKLTVGSGTVAVRAPRVKGLSDLLCVVRGDRSARGGREGHP